MSYLPRLGVPFALMSLLLAAPVQATKIFDPDPTGVSTGVFLEVRGVQTTDEDAGANFISSSATADSEASGMASATFPNPNGTGGSVAAKSAVWSAVGLPGSVSSMSAGLFLGEFMADDGDPLTTSFDLMVDLGIDGFLSVADNASNTGFNASVILTFAAVKENPADPANPLVVGAFTGTANLFRIDLGFPIGLMPPSGSDFMSFGFDPAGFSESSDCADTNPTHTCTVTVNTTESVTFNVNDGELFGLILGLMTQTTIDDGFDVWLQSNFNNTVNLSFPQTTNGVVVTALPPTFQQQPGAVPEPATLGLIFAAALGLVRRRTRPSAATRE